MKVYLTRAGNGSFDMTGLVPILAQVQHSKLWDVFVRVGDWLGLRHFCARVTMLVMGETKLPPRFYYCEAELTLTRTSEWKPLKKE